MDPEAWNRLRRFMEEMGFGRFFVARPENFAWLLGGENTLGTVSYPPLTLPTICSPPTT
ncbi:hypothetical protein [Thermus scotoductus]|uniref:hypothetical protein n=1 Tax=Thermus scotoductus TaxID=37636 RepID=UPI001C12C661|nr:hypothetical protein [Thermus scotoductus]